jgi:integrase
MQGSVFKRTLPSGRIVWCLQLDLGKDTDGRRRRLFRSGFSKKGDAERELQRLLAQHASGDVGARSKMLFRDFVELWLHSYEKARSHKAVEVAQYALRNYILPRIGHKPMQDIDTMVLQKLINEISEAGGRDRTTGQPRALAPRTVARVANVIQAIFKQATVWKITARNPAQHLILPRIESLQRSMPAPHEMQRFLGYLKEEKPHLYPLVALALATGLRWSEILGLQWQDLDAERGILYVRRSIEKVGSEYRFKETKTGRARAVVLPQSLLKLLMDHKKRQDEARRFYGRCYRHDLDLIFCLDDGVPISPGVVTHMVHRYAKRCGLNLRMHDLRHAHASFLLSAGLPLTVVATRLGHSSPAMTARTYSHLIPSDSTLAAAIWDARVAPLLDPDDPAGGRKPN